MGTSAGAVSASILAGNVVRWHESVAEIEKVWANFRVHQVFRSDAVAMLRAGARWMGSLLTGGAMGPPKSLLDNSPLRELLARVTNFDAIRAHVARGDLRALALCATSYYTARSVSFFEAETTVSEWSRAQRHGERVPLSLDYLMASLGIPFLFPPTCLHGEYFGDGAMRQTAPLSPAIHLGADRLLVVGVRPTHLDAIPRFVASDRPPTPGQLFGYMLDTLFSDQISADLENLGAHQPAVGGEPAKSSGARQIRTLMIAPSIDPVRARGAPRRNAAAQPARADAHHRRAWRGGQSARELPDVRIGYTRELIELGFRDTLAAARRAHGVPRALKLGRSRGPRRGWRSIGEIARRRAARRLWLRCSTPMNASGAPHGARDACARQYLLARALQRSTAVGLRTGGRAARMALRSAATAASPRWRRRSPPSAALQSRAHRRAGGRRGRRVAIARRRRGALRQTRAAGRGARAISPPRKSPRCERLPAGAQAAALPALWTLKEAYLKAMGAGPRRRSRRGVVSLR